MPFVQEGEYYLNADMRYRNLKTINAFFSTQILYDDKLKNLSKKRLNQLGRFSFFGHFVLVIITLLFFPSKKPIKNDGILLFNFFYLKLYRFFPEHPEICYQSKCYSPDYILLPELFTESPFGINKESCPDKSETCNKCIS